MAPAGITVLAARASCLSSRLYPGHYVAIPSRSTSTWTRKPRGSMLPLTVCCNTPQTRSKPIYDKIGGMPAIQAAVELFYDKLLGDPQLSTFFEGVDMQTQKRKQDIIEDAIQVVESTRPAVVEGA
ncbi:hypothetical protein WJX72_006236 [[Myrmecia] bisecta]|uniref:Globin-sensor domain-containing protein n=1 Tax=[Myrmecia] bisecta TaxID=41462 RepID=A0AAW1QR38_9CHLO